ncbi:hypothetical protein [Noviherbaspirillum pedocola]|uniref:Carboxypeptidase regulatory-like domain-containing protein n=1 Tax=Noviherbaspirillum pedocola TaxID=2801341 RepID=A0A934W8A2_9BURK|nr:hypothetical protein [Noviherbaspirillum pedocola]MBK4736573.1 hypothetical protein [Noviherbaspirillum pedocola]
MFSAMPSSSVVCAVALTGAARLSLAQSAVPVKPQVAPNGISYVSGGAGEAQQQAMRAAMQDYILHLLFVRPKSGEYLSNVKIRVDHKGQGRNDEYMLDVSSAGPMLFVQLPDGSYRVRAEHGGQVQTKAITIRCDEPKELVYYFPEK